MSGSRKVRIALIQRGPAEQNRSEILEKTLKLIDQASEFSPDFIVLPELANTPYFPVVYDDASFQMAEPVPGTTSKAVANKAREHGSYIVLPIYEKCKGVYYNSALIFDPEGRLVEGTFPDKTKSPRFAKVHIPKVNTASLFLDEKYYYQSGEGFPVFETAKAKVGVLICYDRRFPEGWRSLALQGAEIVFLPANVPAWSLGQKSAAEEMFQIELRTHALENLFFVAACNKAGYEEFQGHRTLFFGKSCVIGPAGNVLTEGPSGEPAIITTEIDLAEVAKARKDLPLFSDRKPSIYKLD